MTARLSRRSQPRVAKSASDLLTVSREAPHGTGVESSSLMLSHHDGEANAIALSSRTICGASARIRLL